MAKGKSKLALTPEQKQLGDFRVRQLKALDEFGVYDPSTFGRMDEAVYEKIRSGIEARMAEGVEPVLMEEAVNAVSEVIFEKPDRTPKKIVNEFESHRGRFNGEVIEVIPAPEQEPTKKRPISEPYSDDVMLMAGFINRLKHEAEGATKTLRATSFDVAKVTFETDKGSRVAKGIYQMLTRIEEQHKLMIEWTEKELEKMKQVKA